MPWYTVLVLFAGIAIVVYGADEAIKRLLGLSRVFRLSAFVTGVVIAGILAVLPELSIGVLSAIDGSASFGLGIILGANVADLTLVIGVVVFIAGTQKMDATMLKNLKISFIAVLLPVILLIDGQLSNVDGAILEAHLVYVIWLLKSGRGEKKLKDCTLAKKILGLGVTVFS